MIGTILGGRYTILEEVGKGGMAHVYKAQCNVLNRMVAVKMLRTDLEGGDEFITRFNAEAQAAACLTHPNIVSIYDVDEENGLYYIVMEYIEGITLKEYIKSKGKLSSLESAEIASQICSALTVAHEKNIVHRDIKPHNIMITKDNLIKVTDFGIARASNSATVQVGESILGSVHYISPEQARGGYIDGRTDIYSLGIVLYEMLTGKLPFESESPIAIAMKHIEETPVLPVEITPDISLELQDIVLKAISKETRKRYQNVTAMKSDLDVVVNLLKASSGEVFVAPEDDVTASEKISQDTINISIAAVKAQKENSDFINLNNSENNTSSEVGTDLTDMENNDSFNADISSNDDSNINQNVIVNNEQQDYYEDSFEPEFEDDAEYDDEDADEYEDEDDESRRTVGMSVNMILTAIIIALFVVGGASLVIGYYVFPDAKIYTIFNDIFGENDVKVPDFTGKQINEATSLAAQYNLKLEVIESEYGPKPEGVVTKQDKAEGNTVKKNTVIKVHTSKGPDEKEFQKLIGQNARNMKDKYEKKGYTIKIEEQYFSNVEVGEIGDVEVVENTVYFFANDGDETNIGKNKKDSENEEKDEEKDKDKDEDKDKDRDEKEDEDKDKDKDKEDTNPDESDTKKEEDKNTASDKKSKTITLDMSKFDSDTTVKVTDPSGKVVYEKTVNPANQPEVNITLEGSGVVNYTVYINGSEYCKYPVNFNK